MEAGNNVGHLYADRALPDVDLVLREARRSLAQLAPALPVHFRFQWHRTGFIARVIATEAGPRLTLVGDLGLMPFSAEAAGQRDRLQQLVQWREQTGASRFVIGPDQHLNLLGDAMVREPLTGASIISAATSVLLWARPYLDLAREQRQAAAVAAAPATPRKAASPARFSAERRRA